MSRFASVASQSYLAPFFPLLLLLPGVPSSKLVLGGRLYLLLLTSRHSANTMTYENPIAEFLFKGKFRIGRIERIGNVKVNVFRLIQHYIYNRKFDKYIFEFKFQFDSKFYLEVFSIIYKK